MKKIIRVVSVKLALLASFAFPMHATKTLFDVFELDEHTTAKDIMEDVPEAFSLKMKNTQNYFGFWLPCVNSIRFNNDRSLIVVSPAPSFSSVSTVTVYCARTGQRLQTFPHVFGVAFSSEFNHDGSLVISAAHETATVYDRSSNGILHKFKHTEDPDEFVRSAHFNHDSTAALTIAGNKAKVWDLSSGTCLLTLEHEWQPFNHGIISSAHFSPDGSHIVIASRDKTAKVWDARSGDCIHTLPHDSTVTSARFNHDGSLITTASYDKTAKIWDSRAGTCRRTLPHDHWVLDAAFNNDGTLLVTVTSDTVKVWNVDAPEKNVTLLTRGGIYSAEFDDAQQRVILYTQKGIKLWDISWLKDYWNGNLGRRSVEQALFIRLLYTMKKTMKDDDETFSLLEDHQRHINTAWERCTIFELIAQAYDLDENDLVAIWDIFSPDVREGIVTKYQLKGPFWQNIMRLFRCFKPSRKRKLD